MKQLVENETFFESVSDLVGEGHSVTLRATGVSMRPFLENRRDEVQIEKAQAIDKYDIVLAKINNSVFVIHRVIDVDGNNFTLMGDGNLSGTERCVSSEIIGKATYIIRNGRRIDCSSKYFRFLSVLWVKARRIRRPLLAFWVRFILRKKPAR